MIEWYGNCGAIICTDIPIWTYFFLFAIIFITILILWDWLTQSGHSDNGVDKE